MTRPPSGPMSPLNTVFLIARREFVTRVRTRVFILGTVVVLVMLTGFMVAQAVFLSKQDTTTTYKMAFLGEAAALADPLQSAGKSLNFKIDRHTASSRGDGDSQVRSGSLDALVVGPSDGPTLIVRDTHLLSLQSALRAIVQQEAFNRALVAAGASPAGVAAAIATATVHVQSLQPVNPNRIALVISGFVVALFLYIALLTYGTFIAQGVVEEKANRIVEILLSTVRPEHLLIGKVLGIGSVGLFQFTIIGAAAFVVASLTHLFSVPADAASVVLAGLLWFVLGYFLYAILFAAAGSLVSRQEEIQGVVFPITTLTIIAWFVAIGVLTPEFDGQPMTHTGVILALIPPISPVLMPSGMATGDIPPPLVLLAVVLTMITSAAATWLAARIYANSVLRIGARVRLGEALRGR